MKLRIANCGLRIALGALLLAATAQGQKLSPTNLTIGGTAVDATSFATASITPASNNLVLAACYNEVTSGTPNTPTATGNGLTYVQVATQTQSSTARLTVFRALGAVPTAGAITFDMAGQTQTNCFWLVRQFNGVNVSGTNGSGAVVQSLSVDCSFGTSALVTLSAFAAAANGTYGVMIITAAEGITPGSGFTEIQETQNVGSTGYTIEDEYKTTNDTTVDWSWTNAHCFAAIAIEIAPARLSRLMTLGIGQ